ERIAEGLTMAGLEVESISLRYPQLKNVVVARIEGVEPHPNADRLKICLVRAVQSESDELLRIVCGAPNARPGMVAPLALPGAELPGGLVREARVRGQVSAGMLCSQKELGLGEDHGGIWALSEELAAGMPLDEALGIKDVLMEVGITPNRGDCLSIMGIAREVAALCEKSAAYPAIGLKESGPPVDSLTSVTLEDPQGCPRYAARVIRGLKIGPSPAWLKNRVEAVGVRSINNVVDVTNYVMMELGQPLHAFDFNRLRDHRIVVRKSVAGERFTTLDSVERLLCEGTVLICDGRGPVAIGGVMGGLNSEIAPDTCDVLLESAYFDPVSIRRTSRRLGLKTEASYRFERGTDPEGVLRALDRAAALMIEVGGGEVSTGRIDVYPEPIKGCEIVLRVGKVNSLLGTRLTVDQIRGLLELIEMRVEKIGPDLLGVGVPGFRSDITREIDLIEEVARLSGYDAIPVTSPTACVRAAECDPCQMVRSALKDLLVGAGFFEVINYSFISSDALRLLGYGEEGAAPLPIRVKNPISDEQAVMRTTLLPGLLNNARYNIDHRSENFKIFELSKVFLPATEGPQAEERHHLAGIMAGKRMSMALYGEGDVDFYDARGVVEHVCAFLRIDQLRFSADALPPWLDPSSSASVYVKDQKVGELGRVHREVEQAFDLKRPVFAFRLDFDRLFSLKGPVPVYSPLPKFPPVPRDLALIADEKLPVEEPLEFIRSLKEPLIESLEIFDIFKSDQIGVGKKSIGYRLTYRAADRSLTDEEVNRVHGQLIVKLTEKFAVSLR
ncbi:MAG: phenylalanine--tRNA ligase subunit beta, partial [Syntrophobacteraceae bacterium]